MIMTIAEREDGVDLEVVIENVQMIIQDREDDPEVDHHDVDKSTNHVMPLWRCPIEFIHNKWTFPVFRITISCFRNKQTRNFQNRKNIFNKNVDSKKEARNRWGWCLR